MRRRLQRQQHRRLLPNLRLLPRILHAGRLRHALRRLRPIQERPEQHAQEFIGRVRRRSGLLERGLRVRVRRYGLCRSEQDFYRHGELLFDGRGRFDVLAVPIRVRRERGDDRGGNVGGEMSDGGVFVLLAGADGVRLSGSGAFRLVAPGIPECEGGQSGEGFRLCSGHDDILLVCCVTILLLLM